MSNEHPTMQTHTLATEYKPVRDPLKQLASAVLLRALEDAASNSEERQQDARRFMHSRAEEHRAIREQWLSLAGLPLDALERFRSFDAAALRSRLNAQAAGRRTKSAA